MSTLGVDVRVGRCEYDDMIYLGLARTIFIHGVHTAFLAGIFY